MNLFQFFQRLDALPEPIKLEEVKPLLAELDLTAADVLGWTCFEPDRYQRNLIRRGRHYEALLLCFEAGQRTPIHDHAGSICGVKVIDGVGSETIFERTADGWLFAAETRKLPTGGVVGSVDMDTHQLSNLELGGRRLMTLHVYAPPLHTVGNYSITDNQVTHVQPYVREVMEAAR
jgi:cysteine dioxygenase